MPFAGLSGEIEILGGGKKSEVRTWVVRKDGVRGL